MPAPLRILLIAALPLTPPGAPAQIVRFDTEVDADEPDASVCSHVRAEVGSLYAGVNFSVSPGETGYRPDADLFLGLQPRIGATALDVSLAYDESLGPDPHGSLAVDVARALGGAASVDAEFRLDSAAETARAEARAALLLGNGVRIGGGVVRTMGPEPSFALDLRTSRAVATNGSIILRVEDGSEAPACAELKFELRF